MTPQQRRDAIAVLGFDSQRSFARFMAQHGGWDEREVRRWFDGDAPPGVDEWLERRRRAMVLDGPPGPAPRTMMVRPCQN